MRFGEVEIEDEGLEGAILAHTLRLGRGAGTIKKGAVLTANDVARLRDAGYRHIMVAQLDPDDVDEDEAAGRLARSLSGPSIRSSSASTGRCNLFANHAGSLVVDRERINAANAVCESITIATLAPQTWVSPETMVATVKIIPFAVREAHLRASEATLTGDETLRVTPARRVDAGLVLTELPGVSQHLLERASRAQRARLGMLGSRIRREVRCAHDTDAVADAIATLRDEDCNPILLLGASAIVDRGDVIPAALARAGGAVVHLGMPVDPGNLLMVGTLGDTTVFGLPGCARSLNPSGFDSVLRRFLTGDTIDSPWIASLGVGGLLKETQERPMPRQLSSRRGERKTIVGLVLAAGESRRMGDTNKLTFPVEGTPMITQVVDALERAGLDEVVVVTGYQADAIHEALSGRSVTFVHNPDYREGIGSSVRTGIAALDDNVDGTVVALGDMPWVGTDVIERLVDAFAPGSELSIYVPMFGRKRGNPVLWASRHFPELRQLTGDVGGKALFHRHADSICYVEVTSAAVNIDVDTPENLHELGIDGTDDHN